MEGGYVSREPTYTNTQAKCDRGAAAHVQTSKIVLYDMFSTQLANSKSSVISGSSSSGLVLALLPLQITCQIAYRGSETHVKLKAEPPKFEFWADFRTLTHVIYGESETRPLQIACQIAYRS